MPFEMSGGFRLIPEHLRTRDFSRTSCRDTDLPPSVISKTVEKIEVVLSASGASLAYAGYPYDPYA